MHKVQAIKSPTDGAQNSLYNFISVDNHILQSGYESRWICRSDDLASVSGDAKSDWLKEAVENIIGMIPKGLLLVSVFKVCSGLGGLRDTWMKRADPIILDVISYSSAEDSDWVFTMVIYGLSSQSRVPAASTSRYQRLSTSCRPCVPRLDAATKTTAIRNYLRLRPRLQRELFGIYKSREAESFLSRFCLCGGARSFPGSDDWKQQSFNVRYLVA